MKIISFLNFKGGVGKTTSTHSIAAALNILGKKVLVLDMDPQGTFTFFSIIYKKDLKGNTKEVLFSEKTLEESITTHEEFDFIGSTIRLATSEMALNNSYSKETRLKTAIEEMENREKYDYCLIDCPPSLSIFTLNALAASHSLIIPCECELASIEGLDLLLETLAEPIKSLNPKLKIMGILPTKLDVRKRISKEILESLEKDYSDFKIFSPIRINSKLSELGIDKQSIFINDKNSNGAKDYMKVAQEIANA